MPLHCRKLLAALALAAGSAFVSAGRAEAQVIDFQVGPAGSCYPFAPLFTTCETQGFRFDFVADAFGISDDGNSLFNRSGLASSGLLGAFGGGSGSSSAPPVTVTMTKIGGGTFGISSFLAAIGDATSLEFVPGFFISSLDITGSRFGGGTVSTSVTIFADFASYSLIGFDNLTSVEFSNSSPDGILGALGFGLDDIHTTSAAPEPATIALLATGFAGLGVVARRRRRA